MSVTTADKPTSGKEVVVTSPGTSAVSGQAKYFAERRFLRGSVNDTAELFTRYPPGAREDAEWLRHFTQTRCGGEHALLGRLAKALGLKDRAGKVPSDQYWYQVVTGRYFSPAGDVGSFRRYVAAIRAHSRSLETTSSIGHVDTENWHLVRNYIDSRRTFSASIRMGGIEGLTGSGKTHCTGHYAAINNHKETIRIEAPARSTRARIVQKIGELYEVPRSCSVAEKEIEIERFLKGAVMVNPDPDIQARPRTIIIENIQRLLRPNVQPDQQPIFNYFHELQDDTGACIIFTWVPSFTKVLKGGHPFWAQFLGRMGGEDEILHLDQKLSDADLAKFAKAFGVANDAAALPLLQKWSSTIYGQRVLMFKLEKARAVANLRGKDSISVSLLREIDLEPVSTSTLASADDVAGGAS